MAPEVMEGQNYTEKIDIYSFGILLCELVTRQMPFHDQYQINTYMDVVDAVLDQGAIPTIPKAHRNTQPNARLAARALRSRSRLLARLLCAAAV